MHSGNDHFEIVPLKSQIWRRQHDDQASRVRYVKTVQGVGGMPLCSIFMSLLYARYLM